MDKYIFVLLLFGCSSTLPSPDSELEALDPPSSMEDKRLRDLEERVDYNEYETMNKFCFMIRDVCYAGTKSECLMIHETLSKRRSCMKTQQDACFKKHEACIVDNYHLWQKIKKAKGYK